MSMPLVQLITRQLTTAGFNQFAIGLGPNASTQRLVLLHHPVNHPGLNAGEGFGLREYFLRRQKGLQMRLFGDAVGVEDSTDFHEVPQRRPTQKWGNCFVRNGGSLIDISVNYSEGKTVLETAIADISQRWSGFDIILWSLYFANMGISPFKAFEVLFDGINLFWLTPEIKNDTLMYFPIANSDLLTAGVEALVSSLPRQNWHLHGIAEPDPQGSLFR